MCPLARKAQWLPCNIVNLSNGHPDFCDFLCGFGVNFTETWKTQVQGVGVPQRNQINLCISAKSHLYLYIINTL